MSAWWSVVDGVIEKHNGRSPKWSALVRLDFARAFRRVPFEKMALHRQDPETHPGTENVLATMVAKKSAQIAAKAAKEQAR